jgi:hypothetical protein
MNGRFATQSTQQVLRLRPQLYAVNLRGSGVVPGALAHALVLNQRLGELLCAPAPDLDPSKTELSRSGVGHQVCAAK